jgi:hypothetical protein
MHQAFSRVFAVKQAETHRIHRWERISLINKRALNTNSLLSQIVF